MIREGREMAHAQLQLSESQSASTPAQVLSDEQLVQGLRRGDQTAGQALVARYHEPLFRYLYRSAGSSQRAEELLQQTWLSVLEHLDQYKPSEEGKAGGFGFKAWLFRIATNKSHDHWRSSGREKRAHQGLKLVIEDEAPDASSQLDNGEQVQRLRQAIDQLPAPQKQVVMMRYFGDLKFVEIAETLGCPLNTALGRMHKAMNKLKTLLDNDPMKTTAEPKDESD
jgi:RNA polymerase sigma-70 factor, ECF subfamily